jgi:hypothetical protein
MKLCFVSVNGPWEPFLPDEPRISSRWLHAAGRRHLIFKSMTYRRLNCVSVFKWNLLRLAQQKELICMSYTSKNINKV